MPEPGLAQSNWKEGARRPSHAGLRGEGALRPPQGGGSTRWKRRRGVCRSRQKLMERPLGVARLPFGAEVVVPPGSCHSRPGRSVAWTPRHRLHRLIRNFETLST